MPNQKFCLDETTSATCLADGMNYSTLPCEAQQYCQAGECKLWVCEPTQATCEGDIASVCNNLGSGYASQVNCKSQQKVCSDGKCLQLACSPSTDFCVDGDTLGHCASDGLSSTSEDCPSQQSCKDAECKPWQCTPNSPVCSGEVATTCDALGLGPMPGGTDCSKTGKYCSLGECTVCEPYCEGKQCGGDGCGGICGTCAEGTSCQGNECKVVCGDGMCGTGENQCSCAQDCLSGCPGCCVGATCQSGTSNSACGNDGAGCTDCSADGKQCQGGECVAQTTPTWTDPVSGLTWQNPPPDQVFTSSWTVANQTCAALSLDGGGWHLPTIDELRSLIRECPATELGGLCNVQEGACMQSGCMYTSCKTGCPLYGGPGANGCYWPAAMIGQCTFYWSSSSVTGSSNEKWLVNYSQANLGSASWGQTAQYRCVRLSAPSERETRPR